MQLKVTSISTSGHAWTSHVYLRIKAVVLCVLVANLFVTSSNLMMVQRRKESIMWCFSFFFFLYWIWIEKLKESFIVSKPKNWWTNYIKQSSYSFELSKEHTIIKTPPFHIASKQWRSNVYIESKCVFSISS